MYRRILGVLLLLVLFSSLACAAPTNLSISINGGVDYTDNATVTLTLSADNTTAGTNCSFANVVGSWSSPEPYSTSKSWNLSSGDGLKFVYFRCTDDGANYSQASSQIILDTTVPSIGSLSPANNSVTTDDTPAISASLSDSTLNSSTIVLKLDGSDVNHSYSSGTASYTPSSSLSEGNHYAEILVYDNVGHSASKEWNFTVDKLPEIDDVYPDSGAYLKSTSFTIYADISDSYSGIDTSSSRMEIDGEGVDETVTSSKIEYSATLEEGEYDVEVFIYDNSGNLAKKNWSFIIDKSEPTVSQFTPADKSTVGYVTVISARVTDAHSGLKSSSLVMKVDKVDVSASTTFSSDVLSYPVTGLSGGTHEVEVWADDEAGNSKVAFWTFTVSSKEPLIDLLTPSAGSVISNSTPIISARLTDQSTSGLNLNSPEIYLDGTEYTSYAKYDNTLRILSYTPASDLSEGKHTVKVKVSDSVGNSAEKNWDFTIDKTAPLPPSGLKVSVLAGKATLSWTASSGASKYRIYKSSSEISSVSGMSPLTTVTKTAYTDASASGKAYYAVTSVDAGGNEGSPAFGGTCAKYDNGWVDYECCSDSDCTLGKCNLTSHKCYTPKKNVTKPEAQSAIDSVNASIKDAEDEGKNVTKAQNLLDQAQSYFNIGNYAQAADLADQAETELSYAPLLNQTNVTGAAPGDKKPLPCCPAAFILLAILSSGIYFGSNRTTHRSMDH